jgi:U3 small nucleolar RNA-associated protein 15
MSTYRPTVVQRPVTTGSSKNTAEARYWAKFSTRKRERHSGKVSAIAFCPSSPHDLAVAAATRITIYNKATQEVKKTIARFHTPVNALSYRPDGQMLAAGADDGLIHIFDTSSRTILRTLTSHQSAVNALAFFGDGTRLLTGGNDKTIRLFDLPTESELVVFAAHTDTIRCLLPSPVFPHVFFSASFDHTVKMYDTREAVELALAAARAAAEAAASIADRLDASAEVSTAAKDVEAIARKAQRQSYASAANEKVAAHAAAGRSSIRVRSAALSVDHGAPVHAIAVHPSGSLLYTAGDTVVKVWDITAVADGGRLVATLPHHQKTVTTLTVDPAGTRLVVGSLDGVLKIYDTRNYRPVHGIRYRSPILTASLSPCGSLLAVGHVDGTLALRYRRTLLQRRDANPVALPHRFRSAAYGHFHRGAAHRAAVTDLVVARERKRHLAPFDAQLRAFNYGGALDAAVATRDASVVCAVVEELLHRGGLGIALGGRDDAALEPIMLFCIKHVTDARYSPLLVDVLAGVLDQYTPVMRQSVAVDELLWRLREQLRAEVDVQADCLCLKGELDVLLAAAEATAAGAAAAAGVSASAAAGAAWGSDSLLAAALAGVEGASFGGDADAQTGGDAGEEDDDEEAYGGDDDSDNDGDLSESKYEDDLSDAPADGSDDDEEEEDAQPKPQKKAGKKTAAAGRKRGAAAPASDSDSEDDDVRAKVKRAALGTARRAVVSNL